MAMRRSARAAVAAAVGVLLTRTPTRPDRRVEARTTRSGTSSRLPADVTAAPKRAANVRGSGLICRAVLSSGHAEIRSGLGQDRVSSIPPMAAA